MPIGTLRHDPPEPAPSTSQIGSGRTGRVGGPRMDLTVIVAEGVIAVTLGALAGFAVCGLHPKVFPHQTLLSSLALHQPPSPLRLPLEPRELTQG